MTNYRIQPKTDFGKLGFYLCGGEKVSHGFEVWTGDRNALPKTWFRTEANAQSAIDVLVARESELALIS